MHSGWRPYALIFSGILVGLALGLAFLPAPAPAPDQTQRRPAALLVALAGAALLGAAARPAVKQRPPAAPEPLMQQPEAPVLGARPPEHPAPAAHSGPKIVAIGGGTGMPQLLRGLRSYTDHITAIVTVADDGGSSGRLRRQMGMLPPGDFRNNIAALSEAEELVTRLFQYRFAQRDVAGPANETSELAGHSFGNLFITTMAAVTGSFEAGIAESSRVLAVRGRVLPGTLEQIELCAEISRIDDDGRESWEIVRGESNIPDAKGKIERVFLTPDQPHAYPAAIQAILQADLIVAGPGSFFTSILPNLLVPAIRDAICAASAPRVYICNVATQPGETEGYTVTDHMRQLQRHAGAAFTTVLANDKYDMAAPPYRNGTWVTLPQDRSALPYRLFSGDLTQETLPSHHDPYKLAARLMAIFAELKRESAPHRAIDSNR